MQNSSALQQENEQLRAQLAQLQLRLDEMQGIFDTMPIMFWLNSKDGQLLRVNRAAAATEGKTPADLEGKFGHELYPRELADAYHRDDLQVMEFAKPKLNIVEQHVAPGTGETTWLQVGKVPYHDGQGTISGVIVFAVDITEQKVAQTERERLHQELIEAQRQAMLELSTPIIPVMDQILVMPLVGSIDTLRAQEITRSMLRGISQQHAHIVIIDITGVPVVDSGVADHLNRTIQAARLKGAHTIITGISDAVAETIVDLGIDWSKIDTLRDLQSGLMTAFERLGYRMQKRS